MQIKIEMSILKMGNTLKVTIPQEIVKALNLKPKQKLLFSLSDSKIIIEKGDQ